jgi:hypothetical protein
MLVEGTDPADGGALLQLTTNEVTGRVDRLLAALRP